MCIIIAKPKNVQLPKREILENCWNNNPDGAGIMYPKNGKIVIDKGYMKKNEFFSHIQKLEKKINFTSVPVILHFRIKTAGKIDPTNCHPFPLSSSLLEMKKIKHITDVGIAHNGIISFCGSSKKHSDTMTFIKEYLYPLFQDVPDILENNVIKTLIEEATNSKFAIMTSKKVYLLGNFQKKDGVFYSNSTFDKISYIRKYENYWENKYDYKEEYVGFCPLCKTYVSEEEVTKGINEGKGECPYCGRIIHFWKTSLKYK